MPYTCSRYRNAWPGNSVFSARCTASRGISNVLPVPLVERRRRREELRTMPGWAHLVVSDLDQAVRMRAHARAEHAGDLLGAEANSEHRLCALQRGGPRSSRARRGCRGHGRRSRSADPRTRSRRRIRTDPRAGGSPWHGLRPSSSKPRAARRSATLPGSGLRLWKTAIILSGIAYAPPRAMDGSPARPHERDDDLTAFSHRQGAAPPACGTGRGPRSVFYPPPCARSIAT